MNIKECYAEFGGDYEGVLSRFKRETMITKFAVKFLDDLCYKNLCDSIVSKDYKEAFRAAHTLKGIGQNLGFVRLYQVSDKLNSILRNYENISQTDEIDSLMDEVKDAYNQVVSALHSLD